jgi:hypothetical protein
MTGRLGLAAFRRPLAIAETRLRPRRVRLPLPAGFHASVQSGQRVRRGARLAPGVHASIDGIVGDLRDGYVELLAA